MLAVRASLVALASLSSLACAGEDGRLADSTDASSDTDASGDSTDADTSSGETSDPSDTGPSETGDEPTDACGGCPEGEVCIPGEGCMACTGDQPCPDAILFAGPDGTGELCSYELPCLLHTAQQRVRERTAEQAGDILVYLRGGTHELAELGPLILEPGLDSGQHGFAVRYRAFPGEQPILSGARTITGWTLLDANGGNGNGIWRAASQAPGSRHLIVDGVLAQRARGPEVPAGFVETATGYLGPDAAMASWQFPTEIEIVGHRYWKSFRCPVAAIEGNAITVAATCWQNAQAHQGQGFDFSLALPQWIENAPELLDEPGEFFRGFTPLTGAYVDAIPRAGQDLARASVREPVLTTLIDGLGEPGNPVHDLHFEGIGFADTTWPLGGEGFAELQAGIHLGSGNGPSQAKMPAAVRFATAQRVHVVDASFTRLGAAGLSFGAGSQDNHVLGGRFEDLGGVAIQIADVREEWHHHPADPNQITLGNSVRDVFITRIGRDYPGSPAIWVGYAQQTQITNNDLFDLPYTGISVGWGWGGVDVGYPTPAASSDNWILANRVGYYLRTLEDGGGIYVLGAQPYSVEQGNYLYNQGNPYGALYLDNGAQFYTVQANVVEKVPYWLLCQTWSTNATNNLVIDNFIELDNPYTLNPNPSNTIANNLVFGAVMPPAAQAIVAASGLSPERRATHPDVWASASASASSNWSIDYAAELAADGEGKTGWSSAGPANDPDPWWQVDLGAPVAIARIEVVTRWDLDQPDTRIGLELLGADEPSFANPTLLARSDATPLAHRAIWAATIDPAQPHRYVRVRRQGGGYMFLAEVRVLAQP